MRVFAYRYRNVYQIVYWSPNPWNMFVVSNAWNMFVVSNMLSGSNMRIDSGTKNIFHVTNNILRRPVQRIVAMGVKQTILFFKACRLNVSLDRLV